MRTMASVWFSVLVLVSAQQAFGNICSKDNSELHCNDCIRCGGYWCNEKGSPHCVSSLEDGWCPNDQEILPELEESSVPGKTVSPIYAQRSLYIMKPDRMDIEYFYKKELPLKIEIYNTTQTRNIVVKKYDTKCTATSCKATIEATPLQDFCTSSSSPEEFVHVTINVGHLEKVTLKYFIPCACECSSKNVVKNSLICNGNGDYSCSACQCNSKWTGEFCDVPICPKGRGDVQCTNPDFSYAECSGNGYCGPCETCICYTDRVGSQYFDQEEYCADICMISNQCEDCLLNSTAGECDSCVHTMIMQNYNETLKDSKDEFNRNIWVACNETVNDCHIDYYARRAADKSIYFMIERSCNDINSAPIVGTPKVSIILGVLGIIAAVAAIGGVMLWKHMNAIPPVPLNDPQYQNIDAEDCRGENPLYKPPTSSFKNPTYGKW
ncbi:unnamed protein product [Chrysodeixis includens]|uniref:Uncharacterized protein n=1 Tax=Chrysodeixis includens TaxID=689277 RepID=A0A9P0FVC3_CHRIL|nr:unnamed protein product [Chrysodeixis includens]